MVDARPDQLKTILKTCPKEDGVSTIEKGKCAKNGKEMDWPIDLKKLFFVCKPTEVSMEKYHDKLVTSYSYLVASKTACQVPTHAANSQDCVSDQYKRSLV